MELYKSEKVYFSKNFALLLAIFRIKVPFFLA